MTQPTDVDRRVHPEFGRSGLKRPTAAVTYIDANLARSRGSTFGFPTISDAELGQAQEAALQRESLERSLDNDGIERGWSMT